jgi:hypothetical protein
MVKIMFHSQNTYCGHWANRELAGALPLKIEQLNNPKRNKQRLIQEIGWIEAEIRHRCLLDGVRP